MVAHEVTGRGMAGGVVVLACTCGWSAQAPSASAAAELEAQHLRQARAEGQLLEETSGDRYTRLGD